MYSQMETHIQENTKKVDQMVGASTHGTTAPRMSESGKMVSSTEKGTGLKGINQKIV